MLHDLRLVGAIVPSLALLPAALATRACDRWAGRHGARLALRWGTTVQSLWARGILAALGVRVECAGTPPRGPFVIAANHISYLDILVLAQVFPSRFVAKSEIAGWPGIGWLGRSVGTIFIRQKQRRDVVRVGREIERTLAAGRSVSVFPEGAAGDGSDVQRFHPSLLQPAIENDLECLGVALTYATPRSEWSPRITVAWWGDMSLFGHLRRLVRLGGVRATLTWAEPRRGRDRKTLAAELHTDVRASFRPLPDGPTPPFGPLPIVPAEPGSISHAPDPGSTVSD